MKVGIFGDSFACTKSDNAIKAKEWSEYLQESSNAIEVVNYGIPGSSIYFSYQCFKKNFMLYDKIIFCGTTTGRAWYPQFARLGNYFEHASFSSILTAPCPGKKEKSKQKTHFTTISSYVKDLYNVTEHTEYARLMIEDVKRANNVLYLPCFEKTSIDDYMPLTNISNKDINPSNHYTHKDIRANHMNDKNNQILAIKVMNWINTETFSLDISDFGASSDSTTLFKERNE
jgi:hypothetical protein